MQIKDDINLLAKTIRQLNERWWQDPHTLRPIIRNMGEMLMLVVTEIAEGFEGFRKDAQDEHLPHRKALEVELADAIIRILDIAANLNMDIGGAMEEKLAYNSIRQDHTFEARKAPGGKKF